MGPQALLDMADTVHVESVETDFARQNLILTVANKGCLL
jgi:hypothetical protein